MAALDFGLLIHATPRGGTLPAMRETNERLLQAAVEHDLTAWFVDHFQIDDQFLLECFAFLAHTAGRYPGLTTGTLVLGQAYRNRTLRVVAEHAEWWNADYYTPADYGRKLRALRDHCREIGRDPATITPTYYAGVSISHDPARLVRRPSVSYRPDMHFLSGSPDEV